MPHYVTLITDTADDDPDARYVVYSTIVDGPITQPLNAVWMHDWLVERDYASWLTPYDPEQMIREHGDGHSDGMHKLWRDQADYMYWNAAVSFAYVKLADYYFVLPTNLWRNGA